MCKCIYETLVSGDVWGKGTRREGVAENEAAKLDHLDMNEMLSVHLSTGRANYNRNYRIEAEIQASTWVIISQGPSFSASSLNCEIPLILVGLKYYNRQGHEDINAVVTLNIRRPSCCSTCR